MIFIQENAAFIQVLMYQDCHNQLLNMINFILLLKRLFPHFNKQWHRVEVGVDKNTVNV